MIIATVGGNTSNSYVTALEAQAYFSARVGGEAWDDVDDVEVALITATAEIDRLSFYGAKTDPDQALKFPRTGTVDDERVVYADDQIPTVVKHATCEMALYLAQNPELLESGGDLSEFKSLQLGNDEVAIQPSGSSSSSSSLPSRVARLLSSLRISQARVIRA
jgi:hypothetical protein